MITVLTRTSNRPNYFRQCRKSVLTQTRRAYHIVSTDDPADTYPAGDVLVRVGKRVGQRGPNLYLNEMRHHVPHLFPFVLFLDDDDRLLNQFVINTLCKHITHPDVLLLWRVNLQDRVIPEPPYWGQPPQPGHITGIGFCFHVRHWVDWEPTHYGDYHVVQALYPKLRPVWIPEILTEMQTGAGLGNRKDLSGAGVIL